MNRLFTLILAIAAAATASSAPVIKANSNNGDWATSATWDLNRKPQSGDTIVIPAGMTINLTTMEDLNGVVIKISGTLSMSSGAKLNLDNASFIRVLSGGTITGQGNSDQIKIGNTHVFMGGSPPINGPAYADLNSGGGFLPFSVMPVTFVNFFVAKENDYYKISWSTASENNNNHFEVEKSIDGVNWTMIATIISAGNTNSITNYSYTDKKIINGVAFYRIKQVDNDGRVTYTTTRTIQKPESNPATEIFQSGNKNITIRFSAIQSSVSIKLWALNGQSMIQQSFRNADYISFPINNSQSGIYVLQVIDASQKSESKKIFLN
jgi:hypothetical protein